VVDSCSGVSARVAAGHRLRKSTGLGQKESSSTTPNTRRLRRGVEQSAAGASERERFVLMPDKRTAAAIAGVLLPLALNCHGVEQGRDGRDR
jgi:hypothetical protein